MDEQAKTPSSVFEDREDPYYVIRVSPEWRPDPETAPEGPMTFHEAVARVKGPDPVSGWRNVAVSVFLSEPPKQFDGLLAVLNGEVDS